MRNKRLLFKPLLFLFNCSVMSDTLRPHELQHARFSCPSPSLGVCSNSCPLSWWCHPTISSPVTSFSSCLQYFPTSKYFSMSRLFVSGGQSTGASASESVLLINTQRLFPFGLTGLISLQSKGLLMSSSAPQFESINSSSLSLFYGPSFTSIHDCWKNHSFDYMDLKPVSLW